MSIGPSLPEWKRFVKSSCSETNPIGDSRAHTENALDIDARKAYEEIIGPDLKLPGAGRSGDGEVPETKVQNAQNPALPPAPPLPCPPSLPASRPTLGSLMRHAELNNCEKIREALKQDSSLINSVDQFGWSLLMVAACAGSFEVAELLLLSGADAELKDKAGHSCKSLARKKGHRNIVNLVKNFIPPSSELPESVEQKIIFPVKRQLCSSCNVNINVNAKKSHLTSTVHQMSQCTRGCRTYFSIPGSNRGYQLMLKNGWNGETGLGPSGSGTKLPPKTTLKRDRKGLGASKAPARITHFQSNDYKAVAANPPNHYQNKVKLNQQIQRDKLIEVSLRRELS